MRNPLERRYRHGDLHFITFSCKGRGLLLGTADARDCFVRILNEVRIRYAFRLIGYVVMPEHVHLLVSEPAKGNPSKFIQALKQRASSALLDKRPRDAANSNDHLWQRRLYDFNVYTFNLLRRDLVSHLKDWPWSSWSHYASGGFVLIPIDRWDAPPTGSENPHP